MEKKSRRNRINSVSVYFIMGRSLYRVHFYHSTPVGMYRTDYDVNHHRAQQLLEVLGFGKKKN